MKTILIVEVTHPRPILNLADLVADRVYRMDGVINADAWLSQDNDCLEATRPNYAREQVLLKLIEVEPDTRDHLIQATGWDADVTILTLDALVNRGVVGWKNGSAGASGRRVYFSKRHQPGDWHEGPTNPREPKPQA